jgi:acyl-CoA reductase-like NAD-dependent aldehyde dehydrogenase
MSIKGKKTVSINPATGKVIGYTPLDTAENIRNAVKLAAKAAKDWEKRSYSERSKHLLRMRDYITNNSERIAGIISADNGKTKMDALSTEVLPVAMAITYYAKKAEKILKRRRLTGGSILTLNKRSYMERAPFGVVGIISPWNYPFAIPFHEVAMALIAGNAVILKVASQTMEVGKILRECVEAGELPDNLFRLVNIPGREAGDAFLNGGINKLFFTGSVGVGKQLMAKASKHLIPVSLELGGNDAMIVCNDANLERAAGGALWAGLSNSGQSCAGVERIFVESGVYDEFMTLLKQKLISLRQGIGIRTDIEIGSMTTAEQFQKNVEYLRDAKKKGASIFPAGLKIGKRGKGLFHPAVIIENVTDDMNVMNGEIFGPLLAVRKVESVEEAIVRTNRSALGLTASVWTKWRGKGRSIASRLEVGTVMINDHLMSHGLAETPWGGWKESGIGRTHGYLGLEEMTQPRCVIYDILPGVQKNMWWYPHNRKVYEGMKGAVDFLFSGNIIKRLRGGLGLTGVFFRTFRK